MERTRLKKLIINRIHMNDLIHQARREGVADRLLLCIRSLDRKASAGVLPNSDWYRPVTGERGETVGYVVGRGHLVASNLTSSMTPKGVRV